MQKRQEVERRTNAGLGGRSGRPMHEWLVKSSTGFGVGDALELRPGLPPLQF
jgi:hypothetical protein